MLFSFAAPVATTFVVLHAQKKQIKREVKWRMIAGIDRDELELIKLTREEAAEELEWEHSKEFEYRGEMYDIVETVVKGDSIFYWCWWDHEETRLNKQLGELLTFAYSEDSTNQRNKERLSIFYKSVYFFDSLPIETTVFLNLKQTPPGYNRLFQSHSFSPPVPPPEVL